MRRLRIVWLRFRSFAASRRLDRELEEELRFHLECDMERKINSGMSAPDARSAALRGFGGVTQRKEECRDARGLNIIEDLIQDVRYGIRMLGRNPGFAGVAVLILALGIGVNTTVFTAYNNIALRPLQAKDPGRMVNVYLTTRDARYDDFFSWSDYAYYRDNNRVFSGVVSMTGVALSMSGAPASNQPAGGGLSSSLGLHFPNLLTQGTVEPEVAILVSENYFTTMGVRAARGRTFLPRDARGPGSDPVVVISHEFWQRRFNSDPNILGKILKLNNVPLTVIGIMPPEFIGTGLMVPNFWIPMMMQPSLQPGNDLLHDRTAGSVRLFARLAPGVTAERAEANMTSLARRLAETYPASDLAKENPRFTLTRGSAFGPPPDADEMAVIVFALAAVGLVLLIACANVASLLLARAAARRKEIAVRLALGAGRWRLVRQLLTESMLIGVAAGAIGLVFAVWTLDLLMKAIVASVPAFFGTIVLHTAPDARVFGYAILLSFAASIAFGLAPAIQTSKPDLTSALKQEVASFGVRLRGVRFRMTLRESLVALQVAVCLLLVIGAALLARASQKALTIDRGFDVKKLVAVEIMRPPETQHDPSRLALLNHEISMRLRAIPGASSVAEAYRSTLLGGWRTVPVSTNGRGVTDARHAPQVFYTLASPEFFHATGVTITRGRGFTRQECEAQAPVAVVSEATARRFWPGQDPVGKRISVGVSEDQSHFLGETAPYSSSSLIIGTAKDVRSTSLREVDPTHLYLPLDPATTWPEYYVRTEGDSQALLPAIARALRSTNANLIAQALSGKDAITNDPAFVMSRLGAILCGMVGFLGLAIAVVGIYGMVSYAVSQRTQEIGIRMALGARRADVLRLVLRETMRPVLLGMALGMAAGVAGSRVLSSLVFGTGSLDFAGLLAALLLLTGVALFAAFVPARRAAAVDPMAALRYE